MNLGISRWASWEYGEVISPLLLVGFFWNECLHMQGKAFPSFVLPNITESWLWKGPSQIGQARDFPHKPLPTIVDIFIRRGNIEDIKLRNIISSAHAEWCEYFLMSVVKLTTSAFTAVNPKQTGQDRKCPVACIDQPQSNARSWITWCIFLQEIQRYSSRVTDSWKWKYTLSVFSSLRGQRIFLMCIQCLFPWSLTQNCQVQFKVCHLIDS